MVFKQLASQITQMPNVLNSSITHYGVIFDESIVIKC